MFSVDKLTYQEEIAYGEYALIIMHSFYLLNLLPLNAILIVDRHRIQNCTIFRDNKMFPNLSSIISLTFQIAFLITQISPLKFFTHDSTLRNG